MGKVKTKKKSLKWSFVKYFFVCAIFIAIGSFILGYYSNDFLPDATVTDGILIYMEDEVYINVSNVNDEKPENYLLFLNPVDLFQCTAIPLYAILCVVICGSVFYRRKIKKPVNILLEASENISNNRLDFSVEVPERNELGEVCLSFEKMRAALNDNYIEMWRQAEERKRLNAAFAHDLRTPLTVLKGQCETIAEYAPKMSEEKTIETAKTMERNILRLEAYVNKMNALQRLEDINIQKQFVNANDFIKQMRETGVSVCKTKEFVFENNTQSLKELNIDASLVMQVYENLLANAVRFAKEKVTVKSDLQGNIFTVTVQDDGIGFTARDLSNATKPFYKSDSETNTQHFGMGLNICKILCEKHAGYLELSNSDGAKCVAAFKL